MVSYPSPVLFMTNKCQDVVRVWAQAHEMHNAGCEVRHARNKMQVSTSGKLHSMMARGSYPTAPS